MEKTRWHIGVMSIALVLGTVASAYAERITGTFTFTKFNPGGVTLATLTPQPIAFAEVEVWRCVPVFMFGVRMPCTWLPAARGTTNGSGSLNLSVPFAGSGTVYGVRVFATNYAAVVWPMSLHTTTFYREPGEPGPIVNRTVNSPSDVRDFSFNFGDAWAAQHFNVAETIRHAFDYASARRDPRERAGNPLGRANAQPTTVSPAGTFYNAPIDTVVLEERHTFEDFVIVHEYAHFLEEQIGSFPWIPTKHDGCEARDGFGNLANSAAHAWMEGFADYFAQAVGRVSTLIGNPGVGTASISTLEAFISCPVVGTKMLDASFTTVTVTPDMVENTVGAVLWDLLDNPSLSEPLAANEPFDTMKQFDREIFQMFDRELGVYGRSPTLMDFHEAWVARGLDAVGLDRIIAVHGIPMTALEPSTVRAGLEGGQQAARNADGRLEVFVRGTDNRVYHQTENRIVVSGPFSTVPGFSGWEQMPGVAINAEPAVIANADGRLQVFVRAEDNAIWTTWQLVPNQPVPGGAWAGWRSLGGVLTSGPAVVRAQDGRLVVFARGTDFAIHHTWQNTLGADVFANWMSLGGELTSAPAAMLKADGGLAVFARGTDQAVWHVDQFGPSGSWSNWSSLHGVWSGAPSIAVTVTGIAVFSRNALGEVWQTSQTTPNDPFSTGWTIRAVGVSSRPAVGLKPDGRLELFTASNGAVVHASETIAGGTWSTFSSLAAPPGRFVASGPTIEATGLNGIVILVRANDNVIWQTRNLSNPAWSSLGGGAFSF